MRIAAQVELSPEQRTALERMARQAFLLAARRGACAYRAAGRRWVGK